MNATAGARRALRDAGREMDRGNPTGAVLNAARGLRYLEYLEDMGEELSSDEEELRWQLTAAKCAANRMRAAAGKPRPGREKPAEIAGDEKRFMGEMMRSTDMIRRDNHTLD